MTLIDQCQLKWAQCKHKSRTTIVPKICLNAPQRPKLLGGLAVPNFELYYWSFQMRALSKWVDPQSTTAWRTIESAKVLPHRLQDILFSSVTNKTIKNNFGPIMAHQTLYKCGRKLNVGWAALLNFVRTCHYGITQDYYAVANLLFNYLGHLWESIHWVIYMTLKVFVPYGT